MTSEQLLVMFLSVGLGVLIVFAIVFFAILISIAIKLRKLAKAAEDTVENIENVTKIFKNLAVPSIITKIVLSQINKYTGKKAQNKSKNKEENNDD